MFGRHIVAVAIGLVFAAPLAAGAQPPEHRPRGVSAREHRQTLRIKDGVKNGELTRGELEKLKADEAAIRAEERVYRHTGDGLSRRERRDLERDLYRTSREIYRAKHNKREQR